MTASSNRVGLQVRHVAEPRQYHVLRAGDGPAHQLALGAVVGCLPGGALLTGQGFTPGLAAGLLAAVVAIALGVGLLAALGPARQGLGIQPMEALRTD